MESGQIRPRRGGAKSIGVHGTPGVGKGQFSRPPPQPEPRCQCRCRTGSASSLSCQLSKPQQQPEPPVTEGDSRDTQSQPRWEWAPFSLPSADLGSKALLPLRALLEALLLRLPQLVPPTSLAPAAHSSRGSP